MPEKTYLISLSQLKELVSSKNPEARQKIMIEVLATPFKERSAGSIIAGAVRSFFSAIFDLIDRETDPKKGGQKP